MKKFLSIIFAVIGSIAFALEPATLTITNVRNEVESDASAVEYVRGIPLMLTNCVAYSGISTASAVENLTGVSIIVKIGLPSSNISYTGTAQVATNGTWYCSVNPFPTNWDSPSIQVKLTNSGANYVYPLKTIKTQAGL